MIRFLKALVLLPVALLVLLLAVANRQIVRVSADPFSPEPVLSLDVPLYVVAFAAVALGILIGGVGAWVGQGSARRKARDRRREIDRLEREGQTLRAARPAPAAGRMALPAPRA